MLQFIQIKFKITYIIKTNIYLFFEIQIKIKVLILIGK